MTEWHYAAVTCVVLLVVWAFAPVNSLVATEVYRRLDEFLHYAIPITLGSAAILFVVLSAPRVNEAPPPSEPCCPTPPPEPSPNPQPTISTFTLIGPSPDGQEAAVGGASVQIGRYHVTSSPSGVVKLIGPDRPTPDTVAEIAHQDFVTRFIRFGDVDTQTIRLGRKMRIITVTPPPGDTGPPTDVRDLQTAFESAFIRPGIEMLPNPEDRKAIVDELYKSQKEEALYDRKTLQRIGSFHGATHGVFFTFTANGEVASRLVNLKTSNIEQIARTRRVTQAASEVGHELADQLLLMIAVLEILNPRNDASCGRVASLDGSARFIPAGWSVWLSVQPQGISKHYPQQRLTVEETGRWYASNVALGEDVQTRRRAAFRLFALLTNQKRSEEIGRYLEGTLQGHNDGIDINGWDKASHRILTNIRIFRDSQATDCVDPN